MNPIRQIIDAFAAALIAEVRNASEAAIKGVMEAAVGPPPTHSVRHTGQTTNEADYSPAGYSRVRPRPTALATAPARKKSPPQLCPVPNCRNRAAPVFGQVCARHKDVPKAKIKKYREARRLAKSKGKR